MLRTAMWLILVSCSLTGCGEGHNLGKPVAVNGQVTVDKKPLANVTVAFSALDKGVPAKYRFFSGMTDDDGAYIISGVYPGEYMVLLTEPDIAPNVDSSDGKIVRVEAVPGTPALAKYSTQSPLRAKVSEDSKTHDFALTGQK